MKYQVYLNKKTSEAINAIAQDQKMKPNHYIKVLLESIIIQALKFAQDQLEIDFEEILKDANIKTTKTGSKH